MGFQDTHLTAERLADALGDSAGEMAVCSTGLIGERLPMDKLLPARGRLRRRSRPRRRPGRGRRHPHHGHGRQDLVPHGGSDAGAAATDGYAIGGMAKGAGMLAPGLATMLCVLTTDADLPAADLDAALRAAVRVTFDRLDTDGCMSTNDTVLLLASGASGVRPDAGGVHRAAHRGLRRPGAPAPARRRGRGQDDRDRGDRRGQRGRRGRAAGRAVARSNLLKCAIAGEDPNWGRVLSAVGTTAAEFEPDRLNVAINGVWVCRNGCRRRRRGPRST